MRKIIALLLPVFLLLPALAFAINNYKAGDQLYVHAPAGLVLRAKPDANGNKIATLPFGASVKVLKENLRKKAHSTSEFKNFSINGFWVKVRTADNKEGYVFDGYLSRNKALKMEQLQDTEMLFIERFLEQQSAKKGGRTELKKAPTRYQHYRQDFANGASVEVNIGEGGSDYFVTFDAQTSAEEAYLIGLMLWFDGKAPMSSVNAKTGAIALTNESDTKQALIQVKNGVVTLRLGIAD